MNVMIFYRNVRVTSALLFLLLLSTGCQLLNSAQTLTTSYGQYYLWLKSLNQDELQQEIIQQKHNLTVNNSDAELYLLLIHALPNSPIHNPYTAKALLNTFQLQYISSRYHSENLAFITMLRDQLNEQLLTLEKLNNAQNKDKENKLIQRSLHQKQQLHQQSIKRLKQQIIQLKKIEQTINNHEQL
ncbi:MAG: hypothetical protein ACI9LM_000601 [Alteromonadaceae bacterium]|jgi:hypothetical protein